MIRAKMVCDRCGDSWALPSEQRHIVELIYDGIDMATLTFDVCNTCFEAVKPQCEALFPHKKEATP